MNIGEIWAALRIDGSQATKDAVKAAGDAGTAAGKSMGDRWKASFSKENLGKGLVQGLGLGAGLGAVGLAASGIQAVAGAISDSVDAAKQFDDQMRTINTVAGVSDAQLGRIGDRIQDLSRETGKTTDELTAGFYDLVSAGIPAEHAMQVLKDSAILATGALGTTGEVVDLLTSTLNAYGMEATESTRVTDIFAKAVADGKVTAGELGKSIATIAPIAAAAGVEIEEVAAGFAQLTKNGVPAAQTATQMRAAISALLTPNAQLAAIQKKVNVNFAELAASDGLAVALQQLREAAGSDGAYAKALGSVEALGFALLTTGDNAAAAAAELKAVEQAADEGGVALGQYEEKSKSAVEQDKRRAAEVQTLMQDVGEMVMPIYDAMIGASSLVVQTIRELGEAFHDLQRLLAPHLAAVEDTDRALVDLAQRYGASEDALLSFAAAERDAAQAAEDEAEAVSLLQNNLSALNDDQEYKNRFVSQLSDDLRELAKVAGRDLITVVDDAVAEFGNFDVAAQGTAQLLDFLADKYGVATDETGAFMSKTDEAREIVSRFFQQIENVAPSIRALNDLRGETTALADAGEASAGILTDAWTGAMGKVRASVQNVRGIFWNLTSGIVDAVRSGIPDVKAVMKDLRWAIEHPMKLAKTHAEIQGALTSKVLARGLRSNNPLVRQAAIDTRSALLTQWNGLPAKAMELGRLTIAELVRGLNEGEAYALGLYGTTGNAKKDRKRNVDNNASGTSYFPGGLTWVGEEGRELVRLPRGSEVYPNMQSERMADGGMSGHSTSYNVTVQGLIRAETPEDIGRQLRRIGRMGNQNAPAPVLR